MVLDYKCKGNIKYKYSGKYPGGGDIGGVVEIGGTGE